MKTPFLGQSYVARSVNAADSRMVNLFPEMTLEGKDVGFLQRCPGLRPVVVTSIIAPVRGMWSYNGKGHYVVGNSFIVIDDQFQVVAASGTIANAGPVSMADNGTQLFIAAGQYGYIYNIGTQLNPVPITSPAFNGATTVCFVDGYFIFNEPNSQRIWATELYDGSTIDELSFASAEGSPDNVVAVAADHRELWVFGETSVEVWYNAGLPDFPFQRIQGAFNEIGCAAAFSVAKADNGLFWLGSDNRGTGIVYRSNGYTGTRISTHAVEWQIQSYGDISDAIGYTYQQDGHTFYVLTFPTANKTWVYDVATQAWHERASGDRNQYRHRSNCQMTLNNTVLVGDYENGIVYTFDQDVYTDNGQIQKWERSWRALPPGKNNLKRTAHHSLQLDCESGVGLDGVTQGTNPQVMLRWSDDGGHTWSNEHWASMGRIGAHYSRVMWRRLGMTMKLRDRVYEVSGTDPVKIAITGAELILSGTNA